ncbi:MAG: hypothetical protein D6813_12960 [Calditrichaeota bacterium]|nr:MAG: hypothetical protein D6813_12960 [Calditrichota bacterium]
MAQKNSVLPGIALIVIGLLLLLNRLDIIYLSWGRTYPIILLLLSFFFFLTIKTKADRGAAFPATFFLVLGLFFFLKNYRIYFYQFYFEEVWPIFLIAVGLGFIALFVFKPDDWGVLIPGSILLFLGTIFFLRTTGIFYWRDLTDFWPVILIIIGLGLLFNGLKRHSPSENHTE